MPATPSLTTPDFRWATGIENTFIPQGRANLRPLDEYELTQHYKLWKSDFDMVAETGVQMVRWGIPWYRVQPAPGRWDWRWIDEALDYAVNVKGLAVILDLMHYGTPLWLDNSFLNARYPDLVAGYAQAVARRYGSLLRYYTPLNEPTVNAHMCGRQAEWPPYLQGNDGYVKVLLALARGIVLTVQALKAEQPEAVTVQVEALWRFRTRDDGLRARVAQSNAQQYLCFDLTTGRVGDGHELHGFLLAHGTSSADLNWFREQAVSYDILGANFYPWSYGEQSARRDGSLYRRPGRTRGAAIAEVLTEAYERYRMPLMVTETSAKGRVGIRANWMDDTIGAIKRLREQEVPILGYTWFPLFTMVDWEYRTGRQPLASYLLHLGLYDSAYNRQGLLQRHPTSLVARYQKHMAAPMPFGLALAPQPQTVAAGRSAKMVGTAAAG